MNGKKILSELIKLFVIINIVLFVINYAFRGNQYVMSQERVKNITKLLGEKGIHIKTELMRGFAPKSSGNLTFIGSGIAVRDEIGKHFFKENWANVKRSTTPSEKNIGGTINYYMLGDEVLSFDYNELSYSNKKVSLLGKKPTLEKAKGMCNKLIERIGDKWSKQEYFIFGESYENYWKITYYPLLEDLPVMDSYLEFYVNSEGVMKAQMYLADIQLESEIKKDIYAVDLVLFGIEDDILESGYLEIEKVTLCYKQEENEENVLGQKIIPAYKVEIKGLEEPLFVNAYTNKRLNG